MCRRDRDITIAQLREEGYKGFYVAGGLQHGGALAVPGGDAEHVISGIDFIRGVHPVSYTHLDVYKRQV